MTSLKIVYIILAACMISTGCKKALEIEPRQSIDAATALNTTDNVNATVTGIYARLKSARVYGRDLIALPEALSDNGFATNKSGRFNAEANNNAGAHFTAALWQTSYAGINDINLVLAAIPALTDASAAQKASIEGQLFFLRGLFYFNLMNAFAYMPGALVASQDKGGVPIVLTGINETAGAQSRLPARSSVVEVYNQIVKDFEDANARFSISAPTDVSLANKSATQAFLSRVNLYRKNYSESKRWSDSAITRAGTLLSDAAGYVNQWRQATHRETLMQIRFTLPSENIGVNESLQTSFTTLAAVGSTITGGFGDLVPTLSLLNDLGITLTTGMSTTGFATNATIATRSADVRNQLYEPGTTGRGARKIETTKFAGKNGAINLDNVPIIRIAEIYLNRAEALSSPGSTVTDQTAALADLNRILVNRGLAAVALTGTALYEEVLRQRRIELAFEGHRFFDLKRLGRNIQKGPHYNDVAFTDFRILAAIPQREIDGNKNLVQNFGY
jgi:hypothetical protein